jgi:divalent metal cation (Fe/Co/Zn/Cd) transporter
VAAENAAATVSGIDHAHAYARWTGRTLRIEIEEWVDPTLSVHDADELGRLVSNAIHDAIPEARAISFTPRAMPSPFEPSGSTR